MAWACGLQPSFVDFSEYYGRRGEAALVVSKPQALDAEGRVVYRDSAVNTLARALMRRYGGGVTALSELTLAVESGQVMAGVNSSGFAPEVDAGRLRLLATFGAQRSPRWPKVPTLRELGFDIVAMSPYGLAGPRGLPPDVLAVLHDGFKKALFDPRFVDDLARYDQEVTYLGPEDYARACREEYAKERASVERMKGSRGAGG